ncbi:LLM class flavin-dependent oxidoreductase [Actinomadura chibensis]|uniref:LLM class flavin-dependent oxidoreductase n=1 Tax=Actinomadura chibensis TaxID=392828 RepID=A0A5D0NHW5_9ACTN|nr:LLM class flavin-dependent oxidoreductase [Actinomadura chibensis]
MAARPPVRGRAARADRRPDEGGAPVKLGVATQGFVGGHGDPARRIREIVAEAAVADEAGLHSFSISEQHFKFPTNVTGPIDVIMAAIARETSRIVIRPGVVITPLHHPLNVAERWAAIDVLADGRMEFGIGRGNTPLTAEAFGVPVPETEPRTLEDLDVILRAWTRPVLSYDGRFHTIAPVAVVPKPVNRPHPMIYWAATSPGSHATAGRLGLGLLTGGNGIHWDQAERRVARYREAFEAATGADTPPGLVRLDRVAILVNGHCAESMAEARRQAGDYVVGYVNRTVEMYEQMVRKTGSSVSFDRARVFKDDLDMIINESPSMFGSPADCVAAARRMYDLGVDEVDVLFDGATHEQHLECLRLLGKEVAPVLAEWPERR